MSDEQEVSRQMLARFKDFVSGPLIASVPQLRRGQVWCVSCGATQKVNAAGCIQFGWPKCCGYTMTIDSPEERAERQAKAARSKG